MSYLKMRAINYLNNINSESTQKVYHLLINTLIFKLFNLISSLKFASLNRKNMYKFLFDVDRLSYYSIDPEQRKQYSSLEMLFF